MFKKHKLRHQLFCLLVHLPGGRDGGGVGILGAASSALMGSTLWPLFNFVFLFFFLLLSISRQNKALHTIQWYSENMLN